MHLTSFLTAFSKRSCGRLWNSPEVFGKDGLLDDLKKALSERILNAEL
ncbi:hypothetical protein GOB19_32920, partial [Sinorhizobium meliloti]|nr:hypothetical protein [Sinorhizobium meliloti]MDX0005085.1 hypothetical protein [Sinorhizobium meliloti]MDX0017696.1 hypothetical protein [Sinorhizobium meliloti]MDX0166645.1 hypothetical protein [Sinorhizobium meliloti]MDX0216348.1 hypothetical protein [Sinorhizobium meliloti]